jgi:hypothetical protein
MWGTGIGAVGSAASQAMKFGGGESKPLKAIGMPKAYTVD